MTVDYVKDPYQTRSSLTRERSNAYDSLACSDSNPRDRNVLDDAVDRQTSRIRLATAAQSRRNFLLILLATDYTYNDSTITL